MKATSPAPLGVTQSAFSQVICCLEAKLEIGLLAPTTRSVAPTSAGERLMNAIGHRFDEIEIEAELEALTELRDKPAGTVRITCGDNILHTVLLPKLAAVLRHYPDIKLEFDMNYGFQDIVADRLDAGVCMSNELRALARRALRLGKSPFCRRRLARVGRLTRCPALASRVLMCCSELRLIIGRLPTGSPAVLLAKS